MVLFILRGNVICYELSDSNSIIISLINSILYRPKVNKVVKQQLMTLYSCRLIVCCVVKSLFMLDVFALFLVISVVNQKGNYCTYYRE